MAMVTSWIDGETMMKELGEHLNAEMVKAAEPLIAKAMAEIEIEIRRRLVELLLARVAHDFSIRDAGHTIVIQVNQAKAR